MQQNFLLLLKKESQKLLKNKLNYFKLGFQFIGSPSFLLKSMKHIFLLFISICLQLSLHAEVQMKDINASLLISNAKTDFAAISIVNNQLKEQLVHQLFDLDLIDHVGSKAYDVQAKFESYYAQYQENYRLIDLNKDNVLELVFNGYVSPDLEFDVLDIFIQQNGKLKRVFQDQGSLLAYAIQPNTGEILLYHHLYPCCQNASHNLNRLRLVNGKITLLKRYFLGRDKGMKGTFFPEKLKASKKYKSTTQKVTLYWSSEIIQKAAWEGRCEENVIAHFASNSVYKILSKSKKGWVYVLMKAEPIQEENRVINPSNFKSIWIYGWLKNKEPNN